MENKNTGEGSKENPVAKEKKKFSVYLRKLAVFLGVKAAALEDEADKLNSENLNN